MVLQLNAFTAHASGGNPAGVVLEADDLSDAQMREIAQQAGFSETAFVTGSALATKHIKFFTPVEEVDLCGHATIAVWSYLFQRGLLPSGLFESNTMT